MLEGLRTVIYPVVDLGAAKAWYSRMLNQAPYFDQPFYVGFNVGGYELGLLPADTPGGAVTYWGVPDAEAAYAQLLEMGATALDPVQEVGEGIRIGAVRDPFGNTLGVITNPHFQLPGYVTDKKKETPAAEARRQVESLRAHFIPASAVDKDDGAEKPLEGERIYE